MRFECTSGWEGQSRQFLRVGEKVHRASCVLLGRRVHQVSSLGMGGRKCPKYV